MRVAKPYSVFFSGLRKLISASLRRGPPCFLAEDRMSMTKSGLACVYCV